MKKTYLLDTNVLIASPYAITAFDEHDVSICDITLEELDKIKNNLGEPGANARKVIRMLDEIRSRGNLATGVQLPLGGGILKIETNHTNVPLISSWDASRADNRILRVCKGMKNEGKDIVLVSNDINMRLKADIIGVPAEEYKTDQMQKIDEQYKGRRELDIDGELIDLFYTNKYIERSNAEELFDGLFVNEFLLLKDKYNSSHTALARFDGTKIVPLQYEKYYPYGITPRNIGQKFMQEALMMSAEIAPLVIIKGPAGSAKTFYSLAVGLEKTINTKAIDREYRKILVTRPNIKFDEDIGYLKGSECEKIEPLIRPIMDNLESLTRLKNTEKTAANESYAQYLFDKGYITAQAMAYMRGRSISDTWIIIDEAQNITPTQAFGIISRAGVNSKVILAGDPEQIDHPSLDSRTNGLTYASERMKGSPICWQITLDDKECVRSKLALEAIKRLSPKGYSTIKS